MAIELLHCFEDLVHYAFRERVETGSVHDGVSGSIIADEHRVLTGSGSFSAIKPLFCTIGYLRERGGLEEGSLRQTGKGALQGFSMRHSNRSEGMLLNCQDKSEGHEVYAPVQATNYMSACAIIERFHCLAITGI